MAHEPFVSPRAKKPDPGFRCPLCVVTSLTLRGLQGHLIARHRIRGQELKSALELVEEKRKAKEIQ